MKEACPVPLNLFVKKEEESDNTSTTASNISQMEDVIIDHCETSENINTKKELKLLKSKIATRNSRLRKQERERAKDLLIQKLIKDNFDLKLYNTLLEARLRFPVNYE